jgi:hypothetical protein
MNPSPVAALIRRWVEVYTRGMPPDVRAARRDEVDDDLWCHHQEAAEIGRSARALGVEMIVRLLLGMPADVSWRFSHGLNAGPARLERRSSMSTRIFGTLAVLAGLSWMAMMLFYGIFGMSAWTGPVAPLTVAFALGGGLAFAATTLGLLWLFQEHLHYPGAIGGAAAGLGGVAAALEGAWAMLLLLIGSAALVWDLARIGVLSVRMAKLHALCAVAMLVPLVSAFVGGPEIWLAFAALFIGYPVSWIAIGTSLLRGVPSPRIGSGEAP